MIQPDSFYARRHKNREPRGCFPRSPRHCRNHGDGVCCSYFLRPGSGLLTREQTEAKRTAKARG
ncbi:MAG: hypothetical protein KKF77_03565 [Proteobacteria bacterium]|nr:hypothetical protein [Pseudomonadota bacterium]